MATIQKFYLRALQTFTAPTAGEKSTTEPVGTQTYNLSPATRDMQENKGAAGTSVAITLPNSTTANNGTLDRWVSGPLAAGTYGNGNWSIAIQTAESDANYNVFWRSASIYFWRPGSSSVVGFVIDSNTASGVEFGNGVANTRYGQVLTWAGANVTIQDGDVLVFEAWTGGTPSMAGASRTATIYFDGTTDVTAAYSGTDPASYIQAPAAITLLNRSLTLTAATITDTAVALTMSAAATLTLTAATITGTAVALTVSAATDLTLSAATVTGTAVALTIEPGGVTLTLGVASITTTAVALTIAAEASISLSAASCTVTAVPVTLDAATAITATAAEVTVTVVPLTVTPGDAAVTLAAADLTVTAVALTVAAGGVDLTLTAATITTSAAGLVISAATDLTLTAAVVTVEARPLTIVVVTDEVLDLTPAVVTLTAQPLTVTAVVSVDLTAAVVNVTGVPVTLTAASALTLGVAVITVEAVAVSLTGVLGVVPAVITVVAVPLMWPSHGNASAHAHVTYDRASTGSRHADALAAVTVDQAVSEPRPGASAEVHSTIDHAHAWED